MQVFNPCYSRPGRGFAAAYGLKTQYWEERLAPLER